MNPRRHPLALSLLASLISSSNAFSFSFTSTPTQCGSLTAQWTGGQAPFTLLLVPTGHLNPETRTIIQQDVSSGNSVTFTLDFPAGSQFVAALNDATGIGAGGTSVITTVGDSSDTSCLNTQQVSPEFFLFLPNTINQCGSTNFSWGSQAQAPVSLIGLIPGGQSFEIASVTGSSTSFDWTADVRQGTDVVFVAGDKNGLGKGGSSDVMSIGSGSDSCINNNAPSSTTGNAAGGVSSTSAGSSGSGFSLTQTGGQLTTTNNAGSTVTVNSPPVLTTTNSQGQTTTITEGQPAMTTTDSSGHTTTVSGIPITTTDNSGSTVTLGGSSFPGSGGGTVTGSSDSSNDSSKNRLPLVLGVVFGLLALLGLLIGAFILWRRRSQHAYSNLENGKGPEADTQPWFARGAHLRGGANSSVSTLPSMYQTEPFIMPSEPQSYYNYSPVPTPAPGRPQFALQHTGSQSQIPPSSFSRPGFHSRANSSRSIHSFLDNAPLTPTAFGYGMVGTPTPASSDSKHCSTPGPHGRPPSRSSSGHALPPGAARAAGSGLPPASNPDPPTRVARDSEDFSNEAEEASPNPFEDPVVDIPPTYASVRRASIRRSLEHTRPSSAGNTRQAAPWGPRPGGGLGRSNASRMSFQTEDGVQGSHSHSHESS